MDSLVFVRYDDVFTTSRAIAESAGVRHASVLGIITRFKSDFEACGEMKLKCEVKKEARRKKKIYLLNERHATLLITYLRNTDVVRGLKKELVRQFFLMREELRHRKGVLPVFKLERRGMTDAIKELPDSPHKAWKYKNYVNLVYKAVTGFQAKELKSIRGCKENAGVHEFLTSGEMKAAAELESKIAVLIDSGFDYGEIKDIVYGKLIAKLKQKFLENQTCKI